MRRCVKHLVYSIAKNVNDNCYLSSLILRIVIHRYCHHKSLMTSGKEGGDGTTPQTEMDALLLGRTHVSIKKLCTQDTSFNSTQRMQNLSLGNVVVETEINPSQSVS